jgi:hypothetical protein
MMERGAVISECEQYRYQLWRIWDRRKPLVCFVMLNPSTADANTDDPTIRRLIGFAGSWGYGDFCVGNLFAYRATQRADMKRYHAPIGPWNHDHLQAMVERCSLLVAAWGTDGSHLNRNRDVLAMFSEWHCIRRTEKGAPEHPLYLPGDLKPIRYESQEPTP